jgi:hypothetical protein
LVVSWLVFTLQAIAWPAAASWIAWLAYRSVQEYARVIAQESKDATLTTAAARAEQALREVSEARATWESAAVHTSEELSTLKGALLERGT